MRLKNCDELKNIFNELKNKDVAIVTHENPDGDGLAAAIALYYCLENLYMAKPVIVMDSEFPDFLDFLEYKNLNILQYKEINMSFDWLVVLDCHEENRVDTDKKIFDKAQNVLIIDHHQAKEEQLKDNYLYYFDTKAVSTGVILHRLMKNHLNNDFAINYANCIYTTILNDTDNFLNSNTDSETFYTVIDLINIGLIPHIVANKFLNRKKTDYFKFIGDVLTTIEIDYEYKILTYYATLDMLKKNNLSKESYQKMMRWTKGAVEADVQVLFQEDDCQKWRISFRSETVNVAKIAQHFGGGGHIKASGCNMEGNFLDIKSEIINYIKNKEKQ